MAVNDSQPGLHGGGGRFVLLVHYSYGVKIFYQAKVTLLTWSSFLLGADSNAQ